MDDTEKFLESLALDPAGLRGQIVSLSSFVNILLAALMGYLVLVVYVMASGRPGRDKNLSMIIPVLSILMAVVMRIQGAQAVLFFGIFGILSLIRFRSDLTDQKGITFILFAVIEGLLIGVNAYLLGLVAWLAVGGAILLAKWLFNRRAAFRLIVKANGNGLEPKARLMPYLEALGVSCAFSGSNLTNERSGKDDHWEERCKMEFALFPKDEKAFLARLPEVSQQLREWDCEIELKRLVD